VATILSQQHHYFNISRQRRNKQNITNFKVEKHKWQHFYHIFFKKVTDEENHCETHLYFDEGDEV